MNKNNRKLELSIDRLALTLESLEEYIRHAGYYSDWKNKEQFYRRTIQGANKWDLEHDEDHFFSNLSICQPWFKQETESVRKETQKEFYKWIDHAGITAENCPEKLKHYLNEINEILEGRGDRFRQAYQEGDDWWEELDLKSPIVLQAMREVNRFFFGEPIPIKSKEIRDVKIAGNEKSGQVTFQQIKNSIVSNNKWTFAFREKYYRLLNEKIKELKGRKNLPQPKEEYQRIINLESLEDTLLSLELYIAKLNYYPNWKISDWTEEEREDWRKNFENKTAEEIKNGILQVDLKGIYLMLRFFKRDDPSYHPILLSELKTKFDQWQSKQNINIHDCPDQLKKVLLAINETLEGKRVDIDDKEAERTVENFTKFWLEITRLMKENGLTDEDLGPQFRDWKRLIKKEHDVAKIKSYQKQIRQAIETKKKTKLLTTDGKPNKIVVGAIVIGVILVGALWFKWVIKNKKVKR